MNLKFIGKTLKKYQWGRDFIARIIKLYRIDIEIKKLELSRKLEFLTYNSKGVRNYITNTYKLAVKMTRYNELKFWFMKTKYPHTKPIK